LSVGGNVRFIRINSDIISSEDVILNGEPYDEQLVEAIAAGDSNNVKIYSHKLKGLARHVAAKKLTDKLFELDTKGRKEKQEGSEVLFAEIQVELDELISFLSQPNWFTTAELKIS